MAIMIPTECNPSTRSKGEIAVYRQLQKTFDDSWTIFHSFDYTSRNLENKLIDVEIDFLLFHPEKGLLVLEVKGGVIKITEDKWFQNDHELKVSPVEQAKSNKYSIKEYLKSYLNAEPPISFGHAICLPDVYSEDLDRCPQIKDIAITGSELNYIDEAIITIMNQFHDKKHTKLDSKMVKTIRKALTPEFEVGSSLIDKFGQEERVFFKLTNEQLNLLDFILKYNTALIEGCAGSGKTVMAIKKAKQLADKGKSVLLMCYNNLLADNLRKEIKGYEDKITASTYHQFCISKLQEAKIKFTMDPSESKYWTEYIPNEFANLIEKQPIKFDALIIDEAQDFLEEYWISITDLLTKDGYYYIFYDPGQNLYGSKLRLPKLSNPFILSQNCRNTKMITDEIKKYSAIDMKSKDELPMGEAITLFKSEDPHLRRKEIGKILHDLVTNKGIKENQIVLLGGHSLSNTCLTGKEKIGKFTIAENGCSDKNQIPYFTYMKYKGCDSDVVILVDVDETDPRWNTNMAKYTAYSRAKHLLFIVNKIS